MLKMETPVIVAIISAAAGIATAAISFFLTKKKERETEWRKLKLEHYREFLDALNGIVGTDSNPDNQRRWAKSTNTIGLVASQTVLLALWKFQDAISQHNQNRSREEHDKRLNELILAIRADLGVTPKDNPELFSFHLWCSGVKN